jgi:FkbM family methyltransferase
MDIFELNRVNQLALAAAADRFVSPADVPERANAFAYHGFIDCEAAPGQGRFVMFSNDDDVVAKHYLFSGPSSFEATTLAVWCQLARQARWVFDIGAFTGVFSLAAAAANPNAIVSAFEPSFITYSRLLTNIYANRYAGQIAPLRFGVGAEAGELELRHPFGVYTMASGESFSANHIADPWFTETVPIISVDRYLSDQDGLDRQRVVSTRVAGADLMKIDVEGL